MGFLKVNKTNARPNCTHILTSGKSFTCHCLGTDTHTDILSSFARTLNLHRLGVSWDQGMFFVMRPGFAKRSN